MKWTKVVTNIHGIYRNNRQTLWKSENLLKSMQEVKQPGAELTRQKKLLEEIIRNAQANEDALISMENGAKYGVNPEDDISVFIDGRPAK
ncbi:hypothetical protein [uncultured Dialister sp.]|uniref:hypothetical protein n=1 Tax=uncultured Dialister sp. TaxID=278064 RepID=UPI002599E4EF|nr:hypothetical protein [uncultured Dialister sp.]